VDQDYIPSLGLEVVEGRAFQEDRASDHENGLLLNEAAVKALGIENPLGQRIIKNKGENDEQHLEVIGVVKDFNTESFDQRVKPVAMQYYAPSYLSDFVVVRLNAGDVSGAVEQVEEVWAQFEPENPFVYSFLDQDFDHAFRAEQRLGNVLTVFTGLAILVACMGLLGLVAFVTARRTKEIGIRKVMGASIVQINHLISRDFLRLVLIAFVVATPLSYWVVERWLEQFAYRTEIGIGIFVLSGLSAIFIAWLTISIQSVRAALANPVDSLRDE
jgi:putative ABC transport system permease protein